MKLPPPLSSAEKNPGSTFPGIFHPLPLLFGSKISTGNKPRIFKLNRFGKQFQKLNCTVSAVLDLLVDVFRHDVIMSEVRHHIAH